MRHRPPSFALAPRVVLVFALAVGLTLASAGVTSAEQGEQAGASVTAPVFAYYYIWFDATSWNRAKTDYPLAGKYSSDERTVMERHVREAKAAGLTGFIVSWKTSDKLNRRLEMLADVAEQNNFKLAIIYQGLD